MRKYHRELARGVTSNPLLSTRRLSGVESRSTEPQPAVEGNSERAKAGDECRGDTGLIIRQREGREVV
jgi:hypothetical protein